MDDSLSIQIVELKRDAALEGVRDRLEKKGDPIQILDECRQGMTIVGERFQAGDYFLAELMLSAEIFKSAAAILDPYLAGTQARENSGKVLLATPKGDIHDLGKNIVATLLKAHGFDVYDLGVDVPPEIIVAKVRETSPDFVGFSALITVAFDSMKQTVNLLEEAGLRNQLKIMVGGGVTTPEVKRYVGADFQTVDATEGVAYCTRTEGR